MDQNSGIPYTGSDPRSWRSVFHSVWLSIYQSLYPPPRGGETGVCLPSSPSHISINKSTPACKRDRSRARTPLALFLLFSILVAVCCTPVAGADDPVPPPITVEADHDEADTWSSVLVIIRVPPFVVNNTTYYTDRAVRLSLVNLDEQKVIVMREVSVMSGVGVFNFRVLPDWGEFVLEIKVLDHNLTGATDVARVKVVYSTEWVIYLLTQRFEGIAYDMDRDNEDALLRQERMTQLMFLIVFVLLTIALLRLEHRYSRILGRSSFWDRVVDRWFNYTIVPPVLWHYVEDERYEFPRAGRRAFKKLRLEFGREQVQVDMAVLTKIEGRLDEEIEELAEEKDKKGEKKDVAEKQDERITS